MFTDPTLAELRAKLMDIKVERDRLLLENQLLKNELLRHGSGMLQIRAVGRKMAAFMATPMPDTGLPPCQDDLAPA